MPISGGDGRGSVTLSRLIEEQQFGDDIRVRVVFDEDEAPLLLHLLLALYFGLSSAVAVGDPKGGMKVRIESGYTGHRVAISLSPKRLLLRVSEQELLYWCRFLTEVVLAVSAVDHIDVEAFDSPNVGVVFRCVGKVSSVDEAEARRLLGL
jgi:hypothetical protein